MRNFIVIILFLMSYSSIISQTNIDEYKFLIRINQLAFLYQMNDFIDNFDFYKNNNTGDFDFDYNSKKTIQDDFFQIQVSYITAQELFNLKKDELIDIIDAETFKYLNDLLHENNYLDFPDELTAEFMMHYTIRFKWLVLRSHSSDSKIATEFKANLNGD